MLRVLRSTVCALMRCLLHHVQQPLYREENAVDIYFPGREALLPFEEARVIEIREIKTPLHRSDAKSRDYLLILGLDSEHAAKILHVKPRVKIGERLAYGDPMGETMISGYLFQWSEPHMHLKAGTLRTDIAPGAGLSLLWQRTELSQLRASGLSEVL